MHTPLRSEENARRCALGLLIATLTGLASSVTGCGNKSAPASADPVDASLAQDGGPAASADAQGPPEPGVPAPPGRPAVLTFRNDNARTGAYLGERELDVAKVRARGMRVKFENRVEGDMNAQPLYVSGLEINGKARDVVFTATTANYVSAFDVNEPATAPTSTQLWQVRLRDPENPTARPLARGIFSTPVIDLASNTMYVVFSTRNTVNDHGKLTPQQTAALDIAFYVAALDIRDGKTLRIKKLEGSYPKQNGTQVAFDARNHWCRPALLLSAGSLYIGCGLRNHELTTTYHGWVFRYDAASFDRQGVFCTSPEVNVPGEGAGIWQSGSGLSEDADGNLYFITGNGPAEFQNKTYGNSLVKLSTKNGTLAFAAAFTPEDPLKKLQENDVDFGSGGALVIPGTTHVLGAGKSGIVYLLGQSSLAKAQEFQGAINQYDPTAPVDANWEGGPHLHGTPAFFRAPAADSAYVYVWGEQDYLRGYKYGMSSGRFDSERPLVGKVVGPKKTMPGGTLSVSANGSLAKTGIVWATLPAFQDPDTNPGGRLFAYDAETLDLLWETQFPSLPKWMPPTVADGKVFMATTSGLFLIYELGPKP